MKKVMLINVLQPEEIRIAILEDGVLEELYVERTGHESYVGNIYKGRIVNIEPSIQAAFVDFGVGRNGFLHVSDVEPAYYRQFEGGREPSNRRDRGRSEPRGRDDRGRDDRGRGRGRDDRGGSRGRDDRRRGPRPPFGEEITSEDFAAAADFFDEEAQEGILDQPMPLDAEIEAEFEEAVLDSGEGDLFADEGRTEEPDAEDISPAAEEALKDDWPTEYVRDELTPEEPTGLVPADPLIYAEPRRSFGEGLFPEEEESQGQRRQSEEPRAETEPSFSPPAETAADTELAPPAAPPEEEPRRRGRKKSTISTPRPRARKSKKATEEATAHDTKPGDPPGIPVEGIHTAEPGAASSESSSPGSAEDVSDTPPDDRPRSMESAEHRTAEGDEGKELFSDEDLSFSTPRPPEKYPRAQEQSPTPPSYQDPEPQDRPGPDRSPEPASRPLREVDPFPEDDFDAPPTQPSPPAAEPVDPLEFGPPRRRDDRGRDDRPRDDRSRGRGRDDRPRDDRSRGRGRDDRPRDDRPRDDRPRDDRPRDDRPRDDRPRDDRPRDDRPRDDRGRDDRGGDRDRGRGGRDRGPRRNDRDAGRAGDRPGDRRGGHMPLGRPKPLIQDIFKRGQEVLVQVIKEGIGTKGPTLSTYISIAGRYLVLMPGLNRIGVSRKIIDEETRRRLREIMRDLQPPPGLGFIIRTAGQDRNQKELQRDLIYLSRLWKVVVRRIQKQKSPCEIYQESDMITRTIRDIFTSDIETIYVDEPNAYEHAKEFLEIVMPRYAERIKLWDSSEPMFHKYGIENEINRIQQRHVPLPNGGSIVIDQTEALVAIDVNSGNFRADGNAEETAYQMNLLAAKEIARQLRLRDLGGVIVNDFIDMRGESHRRNVERALRDAVCRDRARTKILSISQFGIIEMTRQRIRPSLKRSVFTECPHCKGTGQVKTCESMSIEVMRLLQLAAHRENYGRIEVKVQDDVAHYLLNRKRAEIARLEQSGKQIIVRGQLGVAPEHMEFSCQDLHGNEVKFNPYEDTRPLRRLR